MSRFEMRVQPPDIPKKKNFVLGEMQYAPGPVRLLVSSGVHKRVGRKGLGGRIFRSSKPMALDLLTAPVEGRGHTGAALDKSKPFRSSERL
jgi:hypothetical protein